MGFLKEFFSDLDKPAFMIHWESNNNEKALERENKELKQRLNFMQPPQIETKKIDVIDVDCRRMLE